MGKGLDVVGIGNAIVDVLAQTDELFLKTHALAKGSMQLIDTGQAEALYAAMPPGIEISGGSAANTVAGIASLGGRAAYIGKVADDQLGQVFAHDIRAIGVTYATAPLQADQPTARCLILVTPDGERTMNTFLGASARLDKADVDETLVRAAAITYLEGYLFDPPDAKRAFVHAAEIAHAAGRKVALSLSDSFCVERHRESFLHLLSDHVDIVFANEHEIMSLFQTKDWETAVRAVEGRCEIACLTRSAKGSLILANGRAYDIPAVPVARVVDTTGAGDLYAAGVLYGLTNGREPAASGRIGAIAAAEVISHVGARPQTALAALIANAKA
jgi:sugar/nucleoside kinase (ribokinase family)